MNRQDLENLVIGATGRSDKLELIRSALNLAVEELSTKRTWKDLQVEDEVTISSGAQNVALASDVARVQEIRVINGLLSYPLLVREKKWLTDWTPNLAALSTARPTYGYIEGRTLYVIRRPNQDYPIRYTYHRLHPALDSATSELLIRKAGAAVAAWASYWIFLSIEKEKEAQLWFATYEKHLATAVKLDEDDSVIQRLATRRTNESNYGPGIATLNDYWLDPFVMGMP